MMKFTVSECKMARDQFADRFKVKTGWNFYDGLDGFTPKKGKYNLVKTNKNESEAEGSRGGVVWQYFLEDDHDGKPDGWYDYAPTANSCTEQCYQQFLSNPWLDVRFVESGDFTYRIDFGEMTQTNVTHSRHTIRQIRRHMDANSNLKASQGINPVTAAAAPAPAPAQSPAALKTEDKDVDPAQAEAVALIQQQGFTEEEAHSIVSANPDLANEIIMTTAQGSSILKRSNTVEQLVKDQGYSEEEAKATLRADLIDIKSAASQTAPDEDDAAPKVQPWKANDPEQPTFPDDYQIDKHCILQMVGKDDVARYYSLEVHISSQEGNDSFRLYTHYGRCEDLLSKGNGSGQREVRYYGSLEDATKGYVHILNSKVDKGYFEPEDEEPIFDILKIGSPKACLQAAEIIGKETPEDESKENGT